MQPGNPRFRSPNLGIRDGKWKLLINDDQTDMQLYNLIEDQPEISNVADEYFEIAQKLSTEIFDR